MASPAVPRRSILVLGLMTYASLSAADTSYRVIDFGTLGGAYSQGVALNESGQIAGVSDIASGGGAHAFVGNGATLIDLVMPHCRFVSKQSAAQSTSDVTHVRLCRTYARRQPGVGLGGPPLLGRRLHRRAL